MSNEHTNTLYLDMQRQGLLQRPARTAEEATRYYRRLFWLALLAGVLLACFTHQERATGPQPKRAVAGPLFI